MSSHAPASPTICLVGAGNMGGALLHGWLESELPAKALTVVDPGPSSQMAKVMTDAGVHHEASASGLDPRDIVIVAVKPQLMGKVLPGLRPLVDENTTVISVAAGTTISQLAAPFGENTRVVRAMPNTPAMVRRGITVCVGNDGVDGARREIVTRLLEAVGDVDWVDEEALIDAVTGVSGSGPAYVFHLAEALADAGVAEGLDADLAARLARATVAGAGELMRQSELPASRLRENVTSPNGTTAAALGVLMGENGFPQLLTRAVAAAAKRSRELSGE